MATLYSRSIPIRTRHHFCHYFRIALASVLYACYVSDGNAIEYNVIPGGIVNGFTLNEYQYDCSYFLSVSQDDSQENITSQNQTVTQNKYVVIPDIIGLVVEYAIVFLYIALSYAIAFQALLQYRSQKNHTLFKTRINLSLVCLFSVRATGNLLYLIF